jgi:polycomb group RING finger protein 3
MGDPLDRRCQLRELNEMITCKICRGYLVDATTVTECLHTFCKSCIVKHLEDNNTCPECEDVIHQSHPLDYIAYDRTLQDLVRSLKRKYGHVIEKTNRYSILPYSLYHNMVF